MRGLVLVALAGSLAACSPDILSGSYFCGPDAACPEGQACDGLTNTCIGPTNVQPFACLPVAEHEPDNTPQTGTAIAQQTCVSPVLSTAGCLAAGDAQDWYQFTAPTGCTAVEVEVRIAFPEAFEPLALALTDPTGTVLATDTTCTSVDPGNGNADRCLTLTITSGQSYAIEVKPAGGDDCDGTCAFNRYTLFVQLATPS
jgi:hypothetical protein